MQASAPTAADRYPRDEADAEPRLERPLDLQHLQPIPEARYSKFLSGRLRLPRRPTALPPTSVSLRPAGGEILIAES